MAHQLPRGLRNNNPLNIRISNQAWRGKVSPNTDGAFEQFSTIFWGIRAAFVIVRTYIKKYRCTTIPAIISRWAPACENDTRAYINAVCNISCLTTTEPIKFTNKNQVCRLLWAMAMVECGQPVRFSYFETAYAMV